MMGIAEVDNPVRSRHGAPLRHMVEGCRCWPASAEGPFVILLCRLITHVSGWKGGQLGVNRSLDFSDCPFYFSKFF